MSKMPNSQPLIKLSNVDKLYDSNKVIDNLTLEISSGQITCIVGPSGSGKSTLLRMIANIINPDSGIISYLNNDIGQARINGKISYVPQNPTLLKNRNVIENIKLPLEIKKIENKTRVGDLVENLHLKKYLQLYPSQLSGGTAQRVSIARALSFDPEILLMDEPFSALDELLRNMLDKEIIMLKQKYKKTIIFVTHNLEEALYLGDKIVFMNNGEIKATHLVKLKKNNLDKLKTNINFMKELIVLRKKLTFISYDN